MKSNYEKYMKEVWDMKEKAYQDFKKSGYKHYIDFLKNELKNISLIYHKKQEKTQTAK